MEPVIKPIDCPTKHCAKSTVEFYLLLHLFYCEHVCCFAKCFRTFVHNPFFHFVYVLFLFEHVFRAI